jgi:cell division protein FtsA
LDTYLTEKLKMPVRKASANKAYISNSSELENDPALTQTFGLLLLANDDCSQVIVKESIVEDEIEIEEEEIKIAAKPKRGFGIKFPKKEKNPDKSGSSNPFGDIFGGLFKEEEDED